MKDLYQERVRRMNDWKVMQECIEHAHLMERGYLSPEEKHRALICFDDVLNRESMQDHRDMIETAIKVISLM